MMTLVDHGAHIQECVAYYGLAVLPPSFQYGMVLHVRSLQKDLVALYRRHASAHPGDSGLDLFIPEDCSIPSHQTVVTVSYTHLTLPTILLV